MGGPAPRPQAAEVAPGPARPPLVGRERELGRAGGAARGERGAAGGWWRWRARPGWERRGWARSCWRGRPLRAGWRWRCARTRASRRCRSGWRRRCFGRRWRTGAIGGSRTCPRTGGPRRRGWCRRPGRRRGGRGRRRRGGAAAAARGAGAGAGRAAWRGRGAGGGGAGRPAVGRPGLAGGARLSGPAARAGEPLLVVAAWRPEEAGEELALLRRRAERDAAAGPADGGTTWRCWRRRPGVERHAEWLYAETEGLPLFVVEYLAALARAAERTDELPGGVRELLSARLDAVGETAGQLLAAAAVIGRAFDVETLRAASGRGEDETVLGLEELTRRGVIAEREEGYDVLPRQAAGDRLRAHQPGPAAAAAPAGGGGAGGAAGGRGAGRAAPAGGGDGGRGGRGVPAGGRSRARAARVQRGAGGVPQCAGAGARRAGGAARGDRRSAHAAGGVPGGDRGLRGGGRAGRVATAMWPRSSRSWAACTIAAAIPSWPSGTWPRRFGWAGSRRGCRPIAAWWRTGAGLARRRSALAERALALGEADGGCRGRRPGREHAGDADRGAGAPGAGGRAGGAAGRSKRAGGGAQQPGAGLRARGGRRAVRSS